jgi:hypothetical protein
MTTFEENSEKTRGITLKKGSSISVETKGGFIFSLGDLFFSVVIQSN